MSAPGQSYPSVNPYPSSAPPMGNGGGGGGSDTATPGGPPTTGPGSGFPARSGLAGIQPNSYASSYVPAPAGPYRPGMGNGLPEEKNVAQMVSENTGVYARKFQALLDRSTPHIVERWLVTGCLGLLFALNVVLRQGWYIVCYALAIYILNLFLAFLQPRFDPSLQADLAADDVEEGAPGLPGSEAKSPGGIKGLLSGFTNGGAGAGGEDEEFRPFIRRLPEFKFWYSTTKATAIALVCTITRATDVPVYWPILLVYFLTLFGLTMRRQIQHMIKYKYVPFDLGKKARYGGKK